MAGRNEEVVQTFGVYVQNHHLARKPADIDRFVASRVKKRRRELGITQHELATQLGITYQQTQKYENCENRISAGRLFEIAAVLDVHVMYFFPPSSLSASSLNQDDQKAVCPEHILASYLSLSDPAQELVRGLIVNLAKV